MPRLDDIPSDVIRQILVFVPDFKTLLSLLLTSKVFNETYELHPQGIIHDISSTVVGSALPQALRILRCESGYVNKNITDLPSEEDVMKQPITRLEACLLTDNAQVAYGLEDLFSQR